MTRVVFAVRGCCRLRSAVTVVLAVLSIRLGVQRFLLDMYAGHSGWFPIAYLGLLLLLLLAIAPFFAKRVLSLGDDGLHIAGAGDAAWVDIEEARESGSPLLGESWNFRVRGGTVLHFDVCGLSGGDRKALRTLLHRFLGERAIPGVSP